MENPNTGAGKNNLNALKGSTLFTYESLVKSIDWDDYQEWMWERDKKEAETWEKASVSRVH